MVKPFKQKLWAVTTASRGKENICPGHQFQVQEAMDIVMDDKAEEQPDMCTANKVFPTVNEAKLRRAIDTSPPDQACGTAFRNLAETEVKIQVTNDRKRRIVEATSSVEDQPSIEEEPVDNSPWGTTQHFDPTWEKKIKDTNIIPWGKYNCQNKIHHSFFIFMLPKCRFNALK